MKNLILCLVVLSVSAAFIIGIRMAINSECAPGDTAIPVGSIASDSVLVNGKVIAINRLTDPRKSAVSPFPGRDVSGLFPTLIYLSHPSAGSDQYADPAIALCVGNRVRAADRWLQSYMNYSNVQSSNGGAELARCPTPGGQSSRCFYTREDNIDLKEALVGDVYYSPLEITSKRMVAIQGRVYNVTGFLAVAAPGGRIDSATNFLPDTFTSALLAAAGNSPDASVAFSQIPGVSQLLPCMDRLFYAGLTATEAKWRPKCWFINYPLIITTAILIIPLIFKIIAFDLIGTCFCGYKGSDASSLPAHSLSATAIIVPCVEVGGGIESLVKSITDSTIVQQNICRKTLAIFIFDQLNSVYYDFIRVLGNRKSTKVRELYTDVVTGTYAFRDQPLLCMALVLPPDNSGVSPIKWRQISVYQILNLFCQSEKGGFYNLLQDTIQASPESLSYAIVLDSSITIENDHSLECLLQNLHQNECLLAIAGRVQLDNIKYSCCLSFSCLLQLYPSHFKSHLSKAMNNLLGGIVIPNQGFTAFRLRFPTNQPCILHRQVLEQFNNTADSSSADQLLALSALKHFTAMHSGYTNQAVAYKISNESLFHQAAAYKAALLAQCSLLAGRNRFSLRVFWEKIITISIVFWTVLTPAFSAFWYILLAEFAISGGRALGYGASFGALVVLMFLHMIILALFHARFSFLLAVPLFLTIGLPLYGIFVPLTGLFLVNTSFSKPSSPKPATGYPSEYSVTGNNLKNSSKQLKDSWEALNRESFATRILAPLDNTPSSTQELLSSNAASVDQKIARNNSNQPIFQPTNFNENRSQILPRKSTITSNGAPSRANSIARSDYSSHYGLSKHFGHGSVHRSVQHRSHAHSSRHNSAFTIPDSPISTEQHRSAGFSKEEIRDEIRFILQDSDLNSVTRREIKDHLYVQFGDLVEIYSEFINGCIEEFTLEKLALL